MSDIIIQPSEKESEEGGIYITDFSVWTCCPVCEQKCHRDPGKGNPDILEPDVVKMGSCYVHKTCAHRWDPRGLLIADGPINVSRFEVRYFAKNRWDAFWRGIAARIVYWWKS